MTPIDLINHSNFDFYFLVVDPFLSISLPQLKHFQTLTSTDIGIPATNNSGQLLSHPQTISYITQHTQHPRQVAIVPFKPSSKLDLVCRQFGWTLIANPASINRLLEDKIKFPQICSDYNLPTLPHLISPLTTSSFSLAQKKFGQNLVIQTHFGWAGKSTHQASSWSEIAKLLPPQTVVKFSPLIDGYTLLNNCCLTTHGLIQSPPALQFTGIPPLTHNPFATVGRQWPSFAPDDIKHQIYDITQKFAALLIRQHYKGFLGLDFFVNRHTVYLLECNARLTASFAFYTDLELRSNLTPLFFFHLLEFLNLKYPLNFKQESQRFYENITGSELTNKDENGKTLSRIRKYKILTTDPHHPHLHPSLLNKLHVQK